MPPDRVIHADWGSSPRKRWLSVATRVDTRYRVEVPEPVGDLDTFWARAREGAAGAALLIGFDFPIGVPAAYASRAGISNFPGHLALFGRGKWKDFYLVCEQPSEIALTRPFYPLRPGGTRRTLLSDGLGLETTDQLYRLCERATGRRAPASPLFWTLGGKQVGKAAIIGWRDLLAPALRNPSIDLRFWPFDGVLGDLVRPGSVVVAETYPAEACVHLGLAPPGPTWSKRTQAGRAAQAKSIIQWARRRQIGLSPALLGLLEDGFGPGKDAEDPFDALLGVLSMLEVSLGFRPEGTPRLPAAGEVEGWILGQER